MTGPADLHPQKTQLLEFGLGKLDPSETAEIERHLEDCAECCDTLLNLKDDTFLSLVRKSPSPVHCLTEADTGLPRSDTSPAEVTALTGGISLQPTVGSGPDQRTASTTEELAAELRQHPRYELQELIGHGGMGDVYRARHKLMHRTVALKVIRPELVRNEAAVRRFHREVQAAARLQHPHIVTAHDAEQAGNVHFLVMEYVAGVNLHEVLRDRGALPVATACEYVRQIALGLQHAHELGMVHRDIKPHNLMLTASEQVKILDFGLANFASETAVEEQEQTTEQDVPVVPFKHQLTQSGTMMGTPDYIAPEQARDAHDVDIRADIYSLGCTFYTLLTGQAPFADGSVLEKIKAHTQQEAPPLTKFRQDVPVELETVLRKMMAKNPDERYQTPGEVAAALVKLIDVLVEQKLREQTGAGGRRAAVASVDVDADRRRFSVVLCLLVLCWPGLCWSVIELERMLNFWSWSPTELVRVWHAGGLLLGLMLGFTGRGTSRAFGVTSLVFSTVLWGCWEAISRGGGDDLFWLTSFGYWLLAPVFGTMAVHQEMVSQEQPRWSLGLTLLAALGLTGLGLGLLVSWPGDLPPVTGDLILIALVMTLVWVICWNCRADVVGQAVCLLVPLVVLPVIRFLPPHDTSPIMPDPLLFGSVSLVWVGIALLNGTRFPALGNWLNLRGRFSRRSRSWIIEASVLGVVVLLGGIIIVTDRGRLVIQSEVQDVKIVVSKDGQTVETIDLTTGTQIKWLPTGQYELKLVNPDNTVELDRDGFTLHRLGKTIVTARWDGSGQNVIRTFTTQDPTITQNPVEVENGVWKITAPYGNTVAPIRFFEVPLPAMQPGPFFYRAKIRTQNVQGRAYLEMWARFSGQGEYFSKGFHNAITGTTDWAEYEIPFYLQKGQQPDLVKLNLTIENGGTVWIKDIELRGRSAGPQPTQVTGDSTEFRLVRRLEGHRQSVSSLNVVGERLISASDDGVVRIWNLPTGGVLHVLTGHFQNYRVLADLNQEGTRAVTGDWAGRVRIWNLENSQKLNDELGHEGGIYHVSFSPDGSRILTTGCDDTAKIWDTATGKVLQVLKAHTGWVCDGAFSPDGKQVVTVSFDTTARIWNVETGHELRKLKVQGEPQYCVAWSRDGKFIATGLRNKLVRLFSAESGEEVRRFSGMFSAEPGQEVRSFSGHTDRVQDVVFSPDDRFLFSGSYDCTLRAWNVQTGEEVARTAHEHHIFNQLAVTPDGRGILSAGGIWKPREEENEWKLDNDPGLYYWRLPQVLQPTSERLKLVRKIPGHTGQVKQVVFSSDGKLAASISGYPESDHTVRLWDVATGQEIHKLVGLTDKGICVAFTPDGKQVLAAGWDGSIRFWDVQSGRQVRLIPGTQAVDEFLQVPEQDMILISYLDHLAAVKLDGNHTVLWRQDVKDRIISLALCKDGRRFLAGDANRGLTLRNLADGSVLDTYHFPLVVLEDLAVSPDGKTALLAGHGTHAVHFEIDSGKLLQQWPTGTTRAARFSPDGRFAAFADESIQIFDLSTGEEVAVSPETDARYGYWSLAFSPNGQQILAAGSNYDRTLMRHVPEGDYALRLWQLPEKLWPSQDRLALIHKFSGETAAIRVVAFSPDGKLVAGANDSPDADNNVRIWEVATGKELHQLVGHTGKVIGVTFTADSKQVITGSWDDTVRFWDVGTGKEARQIKGTQDVEAFLLLPDQELLLISSLDAFMAVNQYAPDPPSPLWKQETKDRILKIALCGDGKRVLTGDAAGNIMLRSLADGSILETYDFQFPVVTELAVLPDGKTALTRGSGETTVQFDIDTGKQLRQWPLGIIRDLRLSTDGRLVAFADKDIAVMDLATGTKVINTPTDASGYGYWSVAFSPDGRQLLAVGPHYDRNTHNPLPKTDTALRLWQLPEKLWPNVAAQEEVPAAANVIRKIQRFSGHQRTVSALAVSPDGQWIVSASGMPFGDNTARIWDRATGKVRHVLQDHRVPVVLAAFPPDGSYLLTGDRNGQIMLWNPETGERIGRWNWGEGAIQHVVFSPDGKQLFFVRPGAQPRLHVVNPTTGKPLGGYPLESPVMPKILLIRDGKELVIPRSDGVVQFQSVDHGSTLRRLAAAKIDPAESGEALAVAISPDGKLLAVGYKAHTVRLWNLETDELVRDLGTDTFITSSLAFLGDNRHLITCGAVTSAHPDSPAACLLDVETGEVLARTSAPSSPWSSIGDGHAFALVPNSRQFLTAGGAYFDPADSKWKETGDFALRLWELPTNPAPQPAANPQPAVEKQQFSQFFQTLGSRLPALARKAAADEAVFLTDLASEKPADGMIQTRHGLEAKITGEEDRGKAVVTALRDRFKTLSKETGAFVSHLSEDGQDNVLGSNLAYSAPGREGLIRLELEQLEPDKRMPKIQNWTLRIRVEEWPREEKVQTEPASPDALILGDWTESNDPNRRPVHTFKFLESGEYHESGPAILQVEDGPKQWLTKDLDGDGKEEIIPFFSTGVWKVEGNQLLTTQTSNNFLGFIPTPGAIRRLRIEELTPQKLVLTLVEGDNDTERWTFFRPTVETR